MARNNRRTSVEDLVKITSELIDHVKVLVAAVDDLRCEVECWARNAADRSRECGDASACRCSQPAAWQGGPPEVSDATRFDSADRRRIDTFDDAARCDPSECASPSAVEVRPSAAEQLAVMERCLMAGPPSDWPHHGEQDEPPELPTGRIVQVDEELWAWVLDLRPAHVVRMGCCCEEGIGAPYLLAWEADGECFLRELTEREALDLQQACLAAQREVAQPTRSNGSSEPATTQLGLWLE